MTLVIYDLLLAFNGSNIYAYFSESSVEDSELMIVMSNSKLLSAGNSMLHSLCKCIVIKMMPCQSSSGFS